MIDETPPQSWMNNHGAGFCHVLNPLYTHLSYSQVPAPAREHHHTVNVIYTTSMSLTHSRANV